MSIATSTRQSKALLGTCAFGLLVTAIIIAARAFQPAQPMAVLIERLPDSKTASAEHGHAIASVAVPEPEPAKRIPVPVDEAAAGRAGFELFAVHVSDTAGRPLCEAVVECAIAADRSVHLGRATDPGRYAIASRQLDFPAVVTVRADGYAQRADTLWSLPENPLEVVLLPSGRIFGTVKTSSGSVPQGDVKVWAFRSLGQANSALIGLARMRADLVPCALVSGDGSFSIDGLGVGSSYILMCAGDGWIHTSPVFGVSPNGPSPNLLVGKVFGAVLQAVDEYGVAIQSSTNTGKIALEYLTSPPPQPLGAIEAQLCGLTVTPGSWSRHTILTKLATPSESEPRADVTFTVPGYRSAKGQMSFPWARRDLLPSYKVPLEQEAAGFGSIAITATVNDKMMRSPIVSIIGWTPAILEIAPVEHGASDPIYFPIAVATGRKRLFDSIPVGDYSVRLRAAGGRVISEARASVGSSVAQVELDARSLARVHLRPSIEYDGMLEAEFRTGSSSVRVVFDHAPYIIDGLPIGLVNVALRGYDDALQPLTGNVSAVAVEAGTATEATFSWGN